MPTCGPLMRQPGEPDISFACADEARVDTLYSDEILDRRGVVLIGIVACVGTIIALALNAKSPKKPPNRVPAMSSPQETPPDPAAVQECFQRLLANINPRILALRNPNPANRERYPVRQAITPDGQTECSATLALEATRVKKAARGR